LAQTPSALNNNDTHEFVPAANSNDRCGFVASVLRHVRCCVLKGDRYHITCTASAASALPTLPDWYNDAGWSAPGFEKAPIFERMELMNKSNKLSPEFRERAVRMV